MRPPKISNNVLRFPLDEILAAPAHVRLLRVMTFDLGDVVSVTDAARIAGLSHPGARKAFSALEGAGIVRRVGSGRAIKYGLVPENPFLPPLRELFEREDEQYQDLVDSLRSAVERPETREAWIRSLPPGPRRTVDIELVTSVTAISRISDEIRSRLLNIEKKWNLIVELHVYTSADRPEIPVDSIVLWTSGESVGTDHSLKLRTRVDSEEHSRRMAIVLVGMLECDPTLIKRALRYLDRLLKEGQGMADRDLEEWRQLLVSYSTMQLRELLTSDSPRALRLMPFYAVLNEAERRSLQEQTKAIS